MLGVKREVKDNDKEYSVELTMTAYVEGMVNAFKEYQRPKHVSTPFPEQRATQVAHEWYMRGRAESELEWRRAGRLTEMRFT